MPATTPRAQEPFADSTLARLCRYYLDCLSADDAGEIAVWASSGAASNYLELDPDWLLRGADVSPPLPELQAFHEQATRSATPRALKLGLGVLVPPAPRRGVETTRKLLPLLVLAATLDAQGRLRVERDSASLSAAAVRELTKLQGAELQFELSQLEQALGLDEPADGVDLAAALARLRELRPEWGWQPPAGAEALPLADARLTPGLHPRALLMLLDAPRYTHGLETELRKLARLTEDQYRDTALGHLLLGTPGCQHEAEESRILEVLPMNSEQRQAVLLGLTRPLTAVTGPPGTGKSQVISNLLVNCAWLQRHTLFTSKNNKAVDVVDERVNAMGPQPVMVRLGAGEHQAKLAASVETLLAAVVTTDDLRAYEETVDAYEAQARRLKDIEAQEAVAAQLRNETLAQEAELAALRAAYGEDGFAQLARVQPVAVERALRDFDAALDAVDARRAPAWLRPLWPAYVALYRRRLAARWHTLRQALQGNSVPVDFAPEFGARGHAELRAFAAAVRELLHACRQVHRHFHALRRMQLEPLPQLAQRRLELMNEMGAVARKLWHDWVRIRSARMSPAMRHVLSQYAGMLRAVARAGAEDTLPDAVRRQYRDFQQRAQQFLSCFAVTALSAHNRVAFAPGIFDLVIFDEASQCDIASALPLLYRARRVAVIGDPRQLSHISRLRPAQDARLLARAGLTGHEAWMYSTQSLFALLAALAPEDARVHLQDHHRSHPDIIGFSNRYFYDGRLRVATRTERLRVPEEDAPGLRWLEVAGQTVRAAGGSSGNRAEAQAVVAELKRLVAGGYKGTLGVVTPFRHQVELIEQTLRRDAPLYDTLLSEHALQVNTAHGFQGDERDLMIFSVVLSDGASGGAVRFLQNEGNVFNVAITRARAHLLVVGNLAWCASCEVPHLKHFAHYVRQLKQPAVVDVLPEYGPAYPVAQHPTASEAERMLYEALYAAGVRPVPRHPAPPYVLDLAVFDGTRRLAIDVDAAACAQYLEPQDLRRRQVRTQRLLEQGYDVLLFWPAQVRDDTAWCVQQVLDWLQRPPPSESA